MAVVLITDGDERSALAVVRSLGRAGHVVIVGGRARASLAGASRYAADHVILPDAASASQQFVSVVVAAARANRCDLVLPITDASALALLADPGAIAPARVPMAALSSFLRISDKVAVATEAEAVGIRIPRQQRADRREQVAELTGSLRPPLVLKPGRSVAPAHGAGVLAKHGVLHADDWPAALAAASRLADSAFPLLVQERIVGPGVGVFMLRWNARVLAVFVHRRIREKPPSGGVSVLSESIAPPPGLLARSEALLSRFDWSGVAMIEYKIDAASGEPVLMEINGRFWGSLQLAIDAGVDFPALLVDAALGTPVTPVTQWRVGVRGRWFFGDVDHVAVRMSRSASTLHLPPDASGRLATVAAFLRSSLPPWRDQVFRFTDPGPGLKELADRSRGAVRLLSRLLRRD